jgi:hypothetical protein
MIGRRRMRRMRREKGRRGRDKEKETAKSVVVVGGIVLGRGKVGTRVVRAERRESPDCTGLIGTL